MAFDLASMLKDVPRVGTDQRRVEYIDADLIDQNPKNFYSLDGIEELATNIELFGLMDPIEIRPTENGRYMITSGHRRAAAMNILHDDGNDNFRNFPCFVDRSEASPELQELRLIYANASTRVLSPADTAKQVERVTELLYQLQEQGYSFPGRMRDHVAEACSISRSRLARLKVIREKLHPKYLQAFEDGQLGETCAYQIAKESPEVQQTLQRRVPLGMICEATAEKVGVFIEGVKCGTPNIQASHPQPDIKAKLENDFDSYLKGHHQDDIAFDKCLGECADKFFKPIYLTWTENRTAAIDKLKFAFKGSGWSLGAGFCDCTPRGIEMEVKDAEGKRKKIFRSWTEVYDMLSLIAIRRQRTVPTPSVSADPVWGTGKPPRNGLYTVCFGATSVKDPSSCAYRVQEWDGSNFITPGTGVPLKFGKVYGWQKLPED